MVQTPGQDRDRAGHQKDKGQIIQKIRDSRGGTSRKVGTAECGPLGRHRGEGQKSQHKRRGEEVGVPSDLYPSHSSPYPHGLRWELGKQRTGGKLRMSRLTVAAVMAKVVK